ncbi:MAG: two-component system NtrC family sensor kinase [Akkermansiaceae bacterium]|jgi:two-component system NtrC family sensor kinase
MSMSPKHSPPASSFHEESSELVSVEAASTPSFRQTDGDASYRVLIVDDNPSIHDDFRKILCPASHTDPRSDELEILIFGSSAKTNPKVTFELDSAFQGQSALEKLNEALAEDRPYALAFVDIQMPPGWDGVETVNHLWDADPGLQVVICTAYSTFSWEDMRFVLKQPDSLLVLKKPFDEVEIQQMAHTLASKWALNQLVEIGLQQVDEGIHRLLSPTGEAVSAPACPAPAFPAQLGEHQFVTTLERLCQTLESTRGKLRHAEQRLVHSEKMASLGHLSAGILHEINNPLNYVITALTLLENSAGCLPDNCREDHLEILQDIRDGCSKMMEITFSLRKFAHPEGGDLRKVHVNDALRTALRLTAVEIGDVITIENRISDEVIILGKASELSQVFINLIHNATHALRMKVQTPGTVPQILFKATATEGRIIISVTDNGTGIPSSEIGKIFDPFYSTKDVGQGVGLGLGICHQILQQFAAKLSVESVPGTHTRFDLSFPDMDLGNTTPHKLS